MFTAMLSKKKEKKNLRYNNKILKSYIYILLIWTKRINFNVLKLCFFQVELTHNNHIYIYIYILLIWTKRINFNVLKLCFFRVELAHNNHIHRSEDLISNSTPPLVNNSY